MRYFDSGVLLKLYLAERRSPDVVGFVDASENPPPFTELHGLEMRSALRQKEGRGEITAGECATLLGNLEADLDSGAYATPAVNWPAVFAQAETFWAAHGSSTFCRSLDTLMWRSLSSWEPPKYAPSMNANRGWRKLPG